MKALVQRVSKASVSVDDDIVGEISRGLVVFLGAAQRDSKEDASYLANKVVFGTVSSNQGHFERSIESLVRMEEKWPGWLSGLITRRLRLDEFAEGLRPAPDSIKTAIQVT